MAQKFRETTPYKVHREHISSYEKGLRRLPDALVVATARIFGVPVELFPEYAARHVTPEQAAHPLVAWALLRVKHGMTPLEGRKLVSSIEHIRGDYSPLVVEALASQGVQTVELPRLKAS